MSTVLLQNGNARPHITIKTSKVISFFGLIKHPLYSSDMAPSDFHLFEQGNKLGSGYFVVDSVLSLKAILTLPFMCVYTAVIATILVLMLWQVNSAADLKCNSYDMK